MNGAKENGRAPGGWRHFLYHAAMGPGMVPAVKPCACCFNPRMVRWLRQPSSVRAGRCSVAWDGVHRLADGPQARPYAFGKEESPPPPPSTRR